MAGRLGAPMENNKSRTCYSCGNSYPEFVRFCPRDSVDLEYIPESIEKLAQDFKQPWKKWLTVSVIAAFLLTLALYAGLQRMTSSRMPAGNAASGELTVRTTPVGARVYLDGTQIGISPVRLSLPTGVHEVRAVFPGYSEGTAHVEILPSATQRLVWDLSPIPAKKFRNRNRYLAWLQVKEIAAAKTESSEDLM